jgi:hypothetical protein
VQLGEVEWVDEATATALKYFGTIHASRPA